MKKSGLFVLTVAISALASFSALAGEWKQDDTGWWYDNGDSTYEKNRWSWIDERWYYFTPEGYCLVNTTTPDNYQTDENGAWIVDGIIQTKGSDVAVISPALRFEKLEGYRLKNKSGNNTIYTTDGVKIRVSDVNYVEEVKQKYPDETNVSLDLDYVMEYNRGSRSWKKTVCHFNSGEWLRYDYFLNSSYIGWTPPVITYVRLVGEQWHTVSFSGRNILQIDTDAIMNACVQ